MRNHLCPTVDGTVRTIALGRTLALGATETLARVLLILFGLLSAMPSAAAPQTRKSLTASAGVRCSFDQTRQIWRWIHVTVQA